MTVVKHIIVLRDAIVPRICQWYHIAVGSRAGMDVMAVLLVLLVLDDTTFVTSDLERQGKTTPVTNVPMTQGHER